MSKFIDEFKLAEEDREKIEKLWEKFQCYADSNFQKELKTNFYQRVWEMYVCNVLLEKKLFSHPPTSQVSFSKVRFSVVFCIILSSFVFN